MNCKPGDLAYLIKTHDAYADCRGRVVIVCEPGSATKYGHWVIEFVGPVPGSLIAEMNLSGVRTVSAADECLRPISGVPVHDDQFDEVLA